MTDYLRELCLLNGTSGREETVREYILSKISSKAEVKVDPLGNVIAFVKGKKHAVNRVMISAHMDEVGFIITYITGEGYLKFAPVGGIDEKVVFGRRLSVGENGIPGVVCVKPIHLTDEEEAEKCPKIKDMYIDIGAKSREEAERLVLPGDSAYFCSDFVSFGDNKVKAKAIDDRFGCAAMLRMIDEGMEYDTVFAFLVQEEIGCRGAKAAAFTVDPDYAIVLESTTAADNGDNDEAHFVCEQGKGAVVSFMDRGTLYDRGLFRLSKKTAGENGIPWQTKTAVAGGNDAGSIHQSRGGVRTLALSIPCRYIHSATCVADVRDMESVYRLCRKLSEEFANAETG